eukprot:jgi/Astpho2/9335/Aster-x1569
MAFNLISLVVGATLYSALGSAQPVDWVGFLTKTPPIYSGDGTFYGVGQDAQGACSYGSNGANSLNLTWTQGNQNTVAINDLQFNASNTCGMCIKYRGLGTGQGTQPVPSIWQRGFVDNRCPECEFGSIDLGMNGDGRWQIEWYPVPCDTGSDPIEVELAGIASNPYYFMFTVSNTRVPVQSCTLLSSGQAPKQLQRLFNNQWQVTGGPFTFPIHIQVTSVLNDTVDAYLGGKTGTFAADGQFPDRGNDWYINPVPEAAALTQSSNQEPQVMAFGQIGQNASELNQPMRAGSEQPSSESLPNQFTSEDTTMNPPNIPSLNAVRYDTLNGSWVNVEPTATTPPPVIPSVPGAAQATPEAPGSSPVAPSQAPLAEAPLAGSSPSPAPMALLAGNGSAAGSSPSAASPPGSGPVTISSPSPAPGMVGTSPAPPPGTILSVNVPAISPAPVTQQQLSPSPAPGAATVSFAAGELPFPASPSGLVQTPPGAPQVQSFQGAQQSPQPAPSTDSTPTLPTLPPASGADTASTSTDSTTTLGAYAHSSVTVS